VPTDSGLLQALSDRGVIVHAPQAVVIRDIDPTRIEPGVEIYPGVTLQGQQTLLGAGTILGRAGGGFFENVRTGRSVDLFGGYFSDCVFLDGVTIRGHAEVRGGTLLEEGCEAAHHVGYKMTVMMPWTVAGSLVNFCDALMCGGTDRKNHSEIGSTLALYNYTPWGDKFASLFGNVSDGVFLDQPRIFVGGQTQVVSPVHVGFGSVLVAGSPVRRTVGPDRMYGEQAQAMDMPFDPVRFGAAWPKFDLTRMYLENLLQLDTWYETVRIPWATRRGDDHLVELYRAARQMLAAGWEERVKRLKSMVTRLPASALAWETLGRENPHQSALAKRRIDDHHRVEQAWPGLTDALQDLQQAVAKDAVFGELSAQLMCTNCSFVDAVKTQLSDSLRERVRAALCEISVSPISVS
jgi:UDP-N-acetylglucosamine/UDP-N-acetylgalactosamine diphosphorylase